jgi:hypothetical protein
LSDPPVRSLRLLRLANPVVRRVLRSRAHPLLSGRLLLLTYRGRRSGRTFAIPLRYAELTDGRLVAVALRPETKLWWRAFAEPAGAAVTLRGATVHVTGLLAAGAARDEAKAAYLRRYRRSERLLEDAALIDFGSTR